MSTLTFTSRPPTVLLSSTMPIDKQMKGSTNKPITPALSSRFRTAKAPIAPKLATSSPSSPAISSRALRSQTLSPSGDTSQSVSINGNITPRSGSRTTRIGTESPSTPGTTGIRRLSTSSSVQTSQVTPQHGLGIQSSAGSVVGQARPTLAGIYHANASLNTFPSSTVSLPVSSESSKFFHADDARPVSGEAPTPTNIKPKVHAFIHTSQPRTATAPTFPGHIMLGTDHEEKFFRANDAPTSTTARAVRPTMPAKMASMPGTRTRSPDATRSTVGKSPQLSPRKGIQLAKVGRPPSPLKKVSNTSNTTSSYGTSRRRSLGSSSSLSATSNANGHKKSASASTIGPVLAKAVGSPPLPKLQTTELGWAVQNSNQPPQQASLNTTASPDTLSPRSASLTSSKTVTTSVTSDSDVSDIAKALAGISHTAHKDRTSDHSQHQPSVPQLSQAQTEAANARRERKVLDLEISNSSLLAINKTLEKELRKQSSELRRFKRLSRSGRLSFAPTRRSVSAQSAITLDTLSEHADEEEQSEEEDSDLSNLDEEDSSLFSEETDSPDGTTARSRKRARDERRLMLDLSKHQQILIDSQRLSQSIGRCLNFTEELIKDANKALEYKVGIGDLKLGGRVLNGDEDDFEAGIDGYSKERGPARQGLLSPSIAKSELLESDSWISGAQTLTDADIDQIFGQEEEYG